MRERCPNGFTERLLTAYLDGELTQGGEQRVRIHTEQCRHCRELLADLARIREAAMSTPFSPPPDLQWDEHPRGPVSQTLRRLGWWLAVPWLLLVAGFGLWEAWQGTADAFERVIVFAGIAAVALLLGSVIVDRVKAARSDRYREVEK